MSDTWTQLSDAPNPVIASGAAKVGDHIYLMGGYDGVGRDFNQVYNVLTDSWTTGTALPTAYYNHSVASDGTLVYIAGGGPSGAASTTVRTYDPSTDTYAVGASLPDARQAGVLVFLAGSLYYIGGLDSGSSAVSTVYRYSAGSWSTLTAMPIARSATLAAAGDGKINILGGSPTSTRNDEYDVATDTWANKAAMPAGGSAAGYLEDGFVYFLQTASGNTYRYDRTADSYTAVTARGRVADPAASVATANHFYVLAGYDGVQNVAFTDRYEVTAFQEGWGMLI